LRFQPDLTHLNRPKAAENAALQKTKDGCRRLLTNPLRVVADASVDPEVHKIVRRHPLTNEGRHEANSPAGDVARIREPCAEL
jgi:hypothetical protein